MDVSIVWKGLLLPVGLGVGVAMVFFQLTQWEVLFTTLTLAFSASNWLQQRFFMDSTRMRKKTWQVDCGLLEGYDASTGRMHTQLEARAAYADWMRGRVQQGLPIVTGGIDFRWMVYHVRNGEDGKRIIEEESARLAGELSPKYDKGRSDDEVLATLFDLARYMLRALGQTRVYVSFLDVVHTIDKPTS